MGYYEEFHYQKSDQALEWMLKKCVDTVMVQEPHWGQVSGST